MREVQQKLRQEYRESLGAWLKTDPPVRTINSKINELEEWLYESRQYLREKYEGYCNEKDEEKKGWINWLMENEEKRQEEIKKKIRRLKFYLNKGGQNIDILKAKEFPIGELIGVNAGQVGSAREIFLCPLHNEKTPSFVWYKKSNRFKCFGCGEYGDVIDLYVKLFKTGFIEAVKKLL